jgi:C4-dicarboxylate transporter DctM subunit
MTILFLFCFFILVFSGAPLFVIVGAVTALCFAIWAPNVHDFSGLLQVTQKMEQLLEKQEFIAIPLFIASGAVMTAGGIAKRLVAIMRAAFGWIPGGLAISAVAACMFFAANSGS